LYYNWSKNFLEAGKRRLAGDINDERVSSSSAKAFEMFEDFMSRFMPHYKNEQ